MNDVDLICELGLDHDQIYVRRKYPVSIWFLLILKDLKICIYAAVCDDLEFGFKQGIGFIDAIL